MISVGEYPRKATRSRPKHLLLVTNWVLRKESNAAGLRLTYNGVGSLLVLAIKVLVTTRTLESPNRYLSVCYEFNSG